MVKDAAPWSRGWVWLTRGIQLLSGQLTCEGHGERPRQESGEHQHGAGQGVGTGLETHRPFHFLCSAVS